jgi:2-polyprenyl-3-methyl-5-hydroxy-6-metoxy-1,4-benzoquinol methylase
MHRSGSLLDVGCGGIKHSTFDLVCATGDYDLIVGVDAYKPSVDERKTWASARADSSRFEFLHGEIQKMKFDRNFDVILLSHVIEHVMLKEADELLNYLWSICSKQMIVETPNEFEDGKYAVAQYRNPHQTHRCLVDEAFMANHGFTKIFTYFQESGFSNSVYIKGRE